MLVVYDTVKILFVMKINIGWVHSSVSLYSCLFIYSFILTIHFIEVNWLRADKSINPPTSPDPRVTVPFRLLILPYDHMPYAHMPICTYGLDHMSICESAHIGRTL